MKCLPLLLLIIAQCFGQDGPLVISPAGTFRGVWKTTRDGNQMVLFAGIPYAKPPVSTTNAIEYIHINIF